ncbi:MAG: hypothetical protein FJZ79_08735 [Chlorobi bacterium]|nr:hypothetical protein [Chlorobiota bacterium]
MSTSELVLSSGMVLTKSEVRQLEADWAKSSEQSAPPRQNCRQEKVLDCSSDNFRARIIIQLAATALAMKLFPSMKIDVIGYYPDGGEISTGALAVPLTMLAALGVMNAVRHIARRFAIAGTVSAAAFSAIMVLAWMHSSALFTMLGLAGAAVSGLFLAWGGSCKTATAENAFGVFAGFLLSVALLALPAATGGAVSPAVSLMVVALPVCVMVSVALSRIAACRSPFIADCLPVSAAGRNEGIMVSLSLVFPLLAVLAAVLGVSDAMLFTSIAGFCAAYHAVSRRPELLRES